MADNFRGCFLPHFVDANVESRRANSSTFSSETPAEFYQYESLIQEQYTSRTTAAQ